MIVVRPDVPQHEPTPDGLQSASLIRIYDLGIQVGFPGEQPKPRCAFLWELAACRADGTHFLVAKDFNATLADSSNLRALLESWRGGPLSEEELAGFELDELLGLLCTLDLERKQKRTGRSTFVDVRGVYRARRGDQRWISTTPPNYVPEWVARAISEALPPETVVPVSDYVDDRPF